MELLLVDDHSLFRAGLRLLLGSLADAPTVREAADLLHALELAQLAPQPELCLLDLGLARSQGCESLRILRQEVPRMPVVVVSAADDTATIHRCMELGAMSFIPKSASPDILIGALKEVLQGRVWLPAHVLAVTARGEVPPPMTPRQCAVLGGLQRGLPNKLIAREMGISEATVKEHVSDILRTLGARNRVEAVLKVASWNRPVS